MGEKITPVEFYKVKYYCECGGEMSSTGEILMSDLPQYRHECDSCDTTMASYNCYPEMRQEEKKFNWVWDERGLRSWQ